ncbi:MAG: DUF1214 domain-containing protein [Cyclobacteriaceae bacterium]|nr:DUF1214 domain-containing protein [Cyclobacteriaceae bacterium]
MKNLLINFLRVFQAIRRWWLSLRGISENDIHDKRIVNGTAWSEFCDNLKVAGAALVYPGAPTDPMQQAEGVRYLSRLTRAALEAFVEYSDPQHPVFRRMVHETIKMGADNPDNHYLNAQISGDYDYIISGKRNTIHYFGLFTQNGNYGTTGGLSPCGKLEDGELIVNADGSFEVTLSKERRGANWLKIEKETTLLMVRQTYLDRENEVPVEMTIKAIGATGIPGSITTARLDEGLNIASLFVAGAPMLFSKWARDFQKHTNRLPMFDPAISNAAGGDARIIYYHSHWKLDKSQALVITAIPPVCDTWNFQLNNYWMESLDYRYHRICINSHSAIKNTDGTITVIVAHDDPGHANWIQTAGHVEGTMCWRWYRPETTPPQEIETVVMDFEQLKHTFYA